MASSSCPLYLLHACLPCGSPSHQPRAPHLPPHRDTQSTSDHVMYSPSSPDPWPWTKAKTLARHTLSASSAPGGHDHPIQHRKRQATITSSGSRIKRHPSPLALDPASTPYTYRRVHEASHPHSQPISDDQPCHSVLSEPRSSSQPYHPRLSTTTPEACTTTRGLHNLVDPNDRPACPAQ